jgi:hypothetical protein
MKLAAAARVLSPEQRGISKADTPRSIFPIFARLAASREIENRSQNTPEKSLDLSSDFFDGGILYSVSRSRFPSSACPAKLRVPLFSKETASRARNRSPRDNRRTDRSSACNREEGEW